MPAANIIALINCSVVSGLLINRPPRTSSTPPAPARPCLISPQACDPKKTRLKFLLESLKPHTSFPVAIGCPLLATSHKCAIDLPLTLSRLARLGLVCLVRLPHPTLPHKSHQIAPSCSPPEHWSSALIRGNMGHRGWKSEDWFESDVENFPDGMIWKKCPPLCKTEIVVTPGSRSPKANL